MLTEAKSDKLKTVWFVADDFRVIEYRLRELWRDDAGTPMAAGQLFATAAEAYRASAAMMRERAAALLAEADRREHGGGQPAGGFYARFIKAGTPAG